MYGVAIIGWSSREIVPNVWISHPHNGARSREVDSHRSLNTDLGHGWVGMAKTFEHSLTAVKQGERKREWYALNQNGKLASYKRLTQLVRRRCPAGRQDGPKLTDFVTYVERGSPALSPNYFGQITGKNRNRKASGNAGQRGQTKRKSPCNEVDSGCNITAGESCADLC